MSMQQPMSLEVLAGAVVQELGRRLFLAYQVAGLMVQVGGMVIDRMNQPRPRAPEPDLDDEELLALQAADPDEHARVVAERDGRCWTLLLPE